MTPFQLFLAIFAALVADRWISSIVNVIFTYFLMKRLKTSKQAEVDRMIQAIAERQLLDEEMKQNLTIN